MLAQTLPLFLAQGGMIAVVGIVCAILFGGVGGFLGYFIYKRTTDRKVGAAKTVVAKMLEEVVVS